jgi:type III pantothenate kinase
VILIDIGNTNIVFAVSSNKVLKNIIRIESNQNIKKLNISIKKIIKNLIKIQKLDIPNIAVISSVVPVLNKPIIKILKINKISELLLQPRSILPFLKIDYNINEIGSDRIANSIAVINKNIKNSIVIDFGTATTFEVIKEGFFSGGLIFPGINLSKNSLINNTSLLKNTDVVKTKNIVAKNTRDAIRSGFYWGYAFAINGIIKKITNEKKFKPKIILTGGLANIFKNDIRPKPIIKPNLTLEGLQIIGLQYYVKK